MSGAPLRGERMQTDAKGITKELFMSYWVSRDLQTGCTVSKKLRRGSLEVLFKIMYLWHNARGFKNCLKNNKGIILYQKRTNDNQN